MRKATLLAPCVLVSEIPVLKAEPSDYTAGEVTFTEIHGAPDNYQALAKIDGELWQFQSRPLR